MKPSTLRELIRREREQCVYVVEFASGIVKVGRTVDRDSRLRAHERDAEKRQDRITQRWISGPHLLYKANEASLIEFCASKWELAFGKEYFAGGDFDAVVRHAQGLAYDQLTEAEVDAIERRIREARRRAEEEAARRRSAYRGSTSDVSVTVTLRLRMDHLEICRTFACLDSDEALAARMAMETDALTQILRGERTPHAGFIPGIVEAFGGVVAFEDLWEVLPAEGGEG